MNDINLTGREQARIHPPPRLGGDVFHRKVSTAVTPGSPAPRHGMGNLLIMVSILILVLAVYWRTTLSMVSIWARSETFAHGFVVIPIFVYLLWRRKEELSAIEPKPYWLALAGIALAGVCWLAGRLVHAAVVSQLAMMAMVPLAVWAVLGTRIARALVIPLAFLFFAVPFGEALLPILIDRTADFTVAALRASGVPVYRDGNFFSIPSGNWSVVEACSGLRYLIASLMVGCLYAYLSYRSTGRRVAFIAASLVVPIVANWVRAYMIVMLGHLSSNRLAVGVDHLIYGWIFFGVVISLLLWMGSRWREDDKPVDIVAPSAVDSRGAGKHVWQAAAVALVVAIVWQPLEAHFRATTAIEARLTPVAGRDGWVDTAETFTDWRPDLAGARAELRQSFAKDEHRVGLYVALYRGQTENAKAISSTNQLVRGKDAVWNQINAGPMSSDMGGKVVDVRTGAVSRRGARVAYWQWYWIDGRITSSDFAAKLYEAISVLRGHSDAVAWVVIYAPAEIDEPQTRSTLRSFATAMRESIDASLAEAATR